MKVAAISDMHGHLPEIPECDLLLIAGDIIPGANIYHQESWLREIIAPWVQDLKASGRCREIIAVAGNHDLIYEQAPDLVPPINWVYLQDNYSIFEGFKIYGTPWQRRFYNWAFNLDEHLLATAWSLIPDDTDILVTHSPPFGILDYNFQGEELGSPSLVSRVMEVRPKLHVFGHIHYAHGTKDLYGTTFANCAHVGEKYKPIHKPFLFELEK